MPLPAFGPFLDRRDLLRLGTIGAASSALPAWAGTAPKAAPHAGTAKAVIVLWMGGGLSHIDSFDPKPEAPEEIRGKLRTIPTALPGVRYTEVMPQLAGMADRFTLLRTFAAGTDDHLIAQTRGLSGRRINANQITTEPNVGSVLAKLRGPRAGFPGYVAVPGTTRPGPPPYTCLSAAGSASSTPRSAPGASRGTTTSRRRCRSPRRRSSTGRGSARSRGSTTAGSATAARFREGFDARLRKLDAAAAVGDQYRGAFDMLLSPAVRESLDLSREPDKVRDRYGKSKIGARCLLARRLVEAGAGFVMVDYGYDPEYGNLWDNHNAVGQNFPPIWEMAARPYHLAGVDRAASALLDDLAARGLLGQTLVLLLTEFGRTPKVNKDLGRDHWGWAGSLAFAGGGARAGQVIGATDARAAYPTTPAYGPWDVAATVYRALGVDLDTMLTDREGRPVPMLPEGTPIPGVL